MFTKLITIAKNTFIETIRQPIYSILLFVTVFIFILSPSITMYSIDDDNKLLRELGLSTLFLSGLFISIFASIGSITEEIDTKTIMTVLSKPVPRIIFVLGKFFGIAASVGLAFYIATITMLLTFRHGVMETASDEFDLTVLTVAAVVLIGGILITAIFNYTYDWSFTATAVCTVSILATLGFATLLFIDRNWQFNPENNGIKMFDVYSSVLLFLAVLLIISIAIMFSTRFNIVLTLLLCIAVFMLGLVSDYLFGRYADVSTIAKVCRVIIPNLQVFWISDAIYEGSKVTVGYIGKAALYSLCYSGGIICVASALFQGRQVGK